MSRVAKQPIIIPQGVEVEIASNKTISIKGPKGKLVGTIHADVTVTTSEINEDDKAKQKVIKVQRDEKQVDSNSHAGTMRATIQNMVKGVSQGFEEILELVGVGYRAKAEGKTIQLSLGYSHPVTYTLPEGVTAESPVPTQIVLKGADKQKLGQAAAEIRKFRKPEPYKGKGVKYSNEQIVRKETKKK